MKRSPLLLILISLLMGCQPDKEVEPLVVSVEEYEAEALGVGGDCGQPMLRFKNQLAEVEQITGTTSRGGNAYYAYGLGPDFNQPQVLLVRIRKIAADEQSACITLGPGYPWLTVVSARIK
ncbi:hypothetical protein [uncultured Hymenobacter sp.]|uniref:hypothetical protein n=1 Tax=uncultured Hymenobacter sp. TaxID=170016 RepID=UPI0035CAE730